MKTLRTYLDARLALFILLALGASIISSHGAYQFFLYLVDERLAAVFIAVVALGIVGLDAAGTLERGWRKAPYFAGMGVFLLLETLANYFAGQADFVARIVAKLPPSSDLRAIAEHNPGWTRALVVLFLAMASIAVALFTFAAATRFGQLRSGRADRLRRRLAIWRGRITKLVGALRATRASLADARAQATSERQYAAQLAADMAMQSAGHAAELGTAYAELEIAREQSARRAERLRTFVRFVRALHWAWLRERNILRTRLDEQGREFFDFRRQSALELEEVRTDLETERAQSAQAATQSAADQEELRITNQLLRKENERLDAEGDKLQELLNEVRSALESERKRSAAREAQAHEAERAAAALENELEQLRRASALDVKAIAQNLRDAGVSLRAIGGGLGVSEKSIRNWTTDRIQEAA